MSLFLLNIYTVKHFELDILKVLSENDKISE